MLLLFEQVAHEQSQNMLLHKAVLPKRATLKASWSFNFQKFMRGSL
jgi:hypothetical protein